MNRSVRAWRPRRHGCSNWQHRVAQLDVLCGLAELAHRSSYLSSDDDARAAAVISRPSCPLSKAGGAWNLQVPNDTTLDPDGEQILVLTRAKRGGQIDGDAASCADLHSGADGIVCAGAAGGAGTRPIGADTGWSDGQPSRGDSTFMVEMRETNNILQRAPSGPWWCWMKLGVEHRHMTGCRLRGPSLNICTMSRAARPCRDALPRADGAGGRPRPGSPMPRSRSVSIKTDRVFAQAASGGANRSYGIEVAQLAGLPPPALLCRAREILARRRPSHKPDFVAPIAWCAAAAIRSVFSFAGGWPARYTDASPPTHEAPGLLPKINKEVIDRIKMTDVDEICRRAPGLFTTPDRLSLRRP